MGIPKAFSKFLGGYPGGWKQYARGLGEQNATPPFVQPTSLDDRRSLIPGAGLKEYWYPALPDNGVGQKKPVGLKLLGKDLVFFRDVQGQVRALWDYCPHRGVYLSWGDSFWKGYLSCPYHGATFDGDGQCVEFITEGPDSKMVGQLKAKNFPTITLKGLVFVWMGEEEPVPPEEDIPPEFFEKDSVVLHTFRYWKCNWMIALENTGDAHNQWYVHRNSFRMLRSGRSSRTPIGSRPHIIDNKTVQRPGGRDQRLYYAGENGKVPYQLYHPRVKGLWPMYRRRLLWTWFFDAWDRLRPKRRRFYNPPGWEGQRLPGMVRNNHQTHMYTRWPVPVDENLSRVVYFFSARPSNRLGRIYDWVTFHLVLNWMIHYNFSDQDYDAMRSARYQHPEHLSSTDSVVVALRRLVAEHGRGNKHGVQVPEETTAERLVAEAVKSFGVEDEAKGDPRQEEPAPEQKT